MRYAELDYHPADVSSQAAAAQAARILDDAEQTDPGFLVYLLQHSNVLVLAGLRAQGPYNSFSPIMTPARLRRFEALLARHGVVIVTEATSYESSADTSYSFFSPKLIEEVPRRYGAVAGEWLAITDYSVKGVAEWCYVMEKRLATLMSRQDLPVEWLQDWWAPHHLRFGMVLSYPGVAISSNLWADARHQADGHEEPFETVMIGTDAWYGASVGFYVAREPASSPEVQQVCKLWQRTIDIVTRRYSHVGLQADQRFATELAALNTKNHSVLSRSG